MPVYLPDVNLLVAAHVADHNHHQIAWNWLVGAKKFATTPTTEQGLLRVLSNEKSFPGIGMVGARAALQRLRRQESHDFWIDSSSLDNPRIDLSRLRGYKQVSDFHLVNLAATKGGVLVTLDQGIADALAPKDRKYVKTIYA